MVSKLVNKDVSVADYGIDAMTDNLSLIHI